MIYQCTKFDDNGDTSFLKMEFQEHTRVLTMAAILKSNVVVM